MRVRLRILSHGTPVRIRRPGRGERGLWLVAGRVASSGSGSDDPAYELRHQRSGRSRVLRRSRLRLVRTARR
jgi:hypothetical protein